MVSHTLVSTQRGLVARLHPVVLGPLLKKNFADSSFLTTILNNFIQIHVSSANRRDTFPAETHNFVVSFAALGFAALVLTVNI